MTGSELITQFEALVDDSLDNALELQLLNISKNKLENERDWEYLKTWATLVLASGETQTYDLPSDFNNLIKIIIGDTTITNQVPLKDKYLIDGDNNAFYIDMANETITFGAAPTETPQILYVKYTPEITDDTSPLFPAKFHPILSYETAKTFPAIDGGEKARAWDDRWTIYEDQLLGAMRLWDSRLKQQMINANNDMYNNSGIGMGLN